MTRPAPQPVPSMLLPLDKFERAVSPWLRINRFGRMSWGEFEHQPKSLDYVIEDWMTLGDKSIIGGAPGSGKSFLAIDAAMAIALGNPWFGNETKQGLVIYQAGEGGVGVGRMRLRGYSEHFKVPASQRVPFELLTERIDVFAADSAGGHTQAFIDTCNAISADYPGMPLQAIFIDTLSVAQGNADEISGKDMTAVLGNIDRIAKGTGAHVSLVHHLNADGKRLRGHGSLKGNVDQVILVDRNLQTNVRTATLDKVKDGEDNLKLQFELMQVLLGERENGKRITSCVCLPLGEKESIRREEETKGMTLNPAEVTLMAAYFKASERYGQPVPPDMQLPSSVRNIVEWQQVLAAYAVMNPIDEDTADKTPEEFAKIKAAHKEKHKKRVGRAREYLQRSGVLGVEGKDVSYAYFNGRPLRAFPATQPRSEPPPEQESATIGTSPTDIVF